MSMFDKRSAAEPKDPPAAAVATPPQQPPPAPKPKPEATALIGPTLSLSGEITGSEDLRIDGKVDGNIKLRDHVITVTHSGEVRANITASTVNISGRVVGDITGIEQVALTKSAWVQGNITAPVVHLESGSKFKGSIDMDPVDEQGADGPKAGKQQSATQATASLATASAKADSAAAKSA